LFKFFIGSHYSYLIFKVCRAITAFFIANRSDNNMNESLKFLLSFVLQSEKESKEPNSSSGTNGGTPSQSDDKRALKLSSSDSSSPNVSRAAVTSSSGANSPPVSHVPQHPAVVYYSHSSSCFYSRYAYRVFVDSFAATLKNNVWK
jgi:hypothetical protein